jgi:hypothetical protein
MLFPETWPNDCPPADAIDASGVVFRIVKNKPPLPEDFVTHFEADKLRNADPCLRCGLSVFQEIGDAVHQRWLLPKLGRLIARGTLRTDHGKTKLTPGKQPSHTTWWPYTEVDRASIFSIAPDEV